MYTSYIGKKFLKLYREKYNKPDEYSARQFSDDVLFPVFFNDGKHLMHVHGSTFFQAVGKSELQNGQSEHLFRLNRLHQDIENERYSGSTFVGYAAGKIDQPTSGQLTTLDCKIDAEEAYASWIGEGLSVGVSGGLILFLEADILWAIFQGWMYYRKYIIQTPNIKGRQIETWNGHWLCHYFSKRFDELDPLANFTFPTGNNDEEKGGAILTQSWVKVIFALTKKFPRQVITCYCYFLGKTNTTLGFINVHIPEINYLYEVRDKLFLNKEDFILKDKEIEQLETFYYFKDACKLGTIGLKALEPAKLREFMPKGSFDYAQGKDFKFSDNNSYLFYQLYKIWIIAMPNKTELLQLASDVAKALIEIEKSQSTREQTKKTGSQNSKDLMNSKNIKSFIEGLTDLIKTENRDTFRRVVDEVLKIPSDSFHYSQLLFDPNMLI